MKKQNVHTIIKIITGFYFLFLSVQLPAQVCTSYGNIVWQQTFGKGPNPGPSLPPGLTNYLYTSNLCPTEGYYTIGNTVPDCFANSWWDSIQCCTTGDSAIGYMMLINASVNPGDVYVDTVKNLCGKTNYRFTAEIINISLPSSCGGHPIRPWLTFTIEDQGGTPIAAYNTGNIVESSSGTGPGQFHVDFYTPSGVNTVVIRITDNAPGGCGNDFALDNIYVSACGPAVQAGIKDMNGSYLDVCTGNTASITLFATVGASNYTSTAYQWQIYNGTDWVDIPNATSVNYTLSPTLAAGAYKYRITIAEADNIGSSRCRVASDDVTINVHNPTAAGAATSNSPVCVNSTINLSATGGGSYQWTGPANFISAEANPGFTATNTSAGLYTVIIADNYGCKSTATTMVNLIAAPTAVVSTAQSICKGDSVMLHASGGTSYVWLPVNNLSNAAISNPIAKPVSTSTYTVTVTDNNHCTNAASVLVVVNTKPIISAGEDKVTIKGQSVTLDGSIKDVSNVNFSWVASPSLNDVHLLNPVVNPIMNTDYVLTATSAIGCGISIDTVLVIVYNDLYIPNAFTPNGDGLNDTWHIPALRAFSNAVTTVYNRYGNKIFESSGGKKDWDGNFKNVPQPPGAYVYVIDLKNNKPVIKGTVIIIR